MAVYIDTVVDAIEQFDHQVVLVGHSMTGTVISQVAERIPEKIERLVYVAAFLLKEGGTVLETMQGDTGGEFFPRVEFSDDQSFATVPVEALRSVGFHDVEEEVIEQVLPLMVERQATEPFMAKVVVSQERFGSVPKTYIRTSLDKVTTPELQDRMIANWDVDSVLRIESGHFPLFSAPEKLAELLMVGEPCGTDACTTEGSKDDACETDACSTSKLGV